MEVTADHAGGSIEVLDASDPGNVRLALRPDPVSANEGGKVFHQHFDFLVRRRPALVAMATGGSAALRTDAPSDPPASPPLEPPPLAGVPGGRLVLRIENAGAAMCPFDGYTAMARLTTAAEATTAESTAATGSASGGPWTRVAATTLEAGPAAGERHLVIDCTALIAAAGPTAVDAAGRAATVLHVAYFQPYAYDTQHAALIARCLVPCPDVRVRRTCAAVSVQGREVDLLTITAAPANDATAAAPIKREVWIVCRQHPAETMAEWWAEGFLGRLLGWDGGRAGSGRADGDVARDRLLQGAVINIIPCANPDGAAEGLTRTNAAGSNLNREWAGPDPDQTPELVGILGAIGACDLVIDVHGDENLPRAVLCCAPAWDDRLSALQTRFWEALAAANGDFCLADSLPHLITKPPAPAADAAALSKTGADRMDKMGETGANLTLCSTQLAHRHDCLAMTLEQCFLPPWNAEASLRLGADFVPVIADILPHLRQ